MIKRRDFLQVLGSLMAASAIQWSPAELEAVQIPPCQKPVPAHVHHLPQREFYVAIDGRDVTEHIAAVELEISVASMEDTAWGDSCRTFRAGAQTVRFRTDFLVDLSGDDPWFEQLDGSVWTIEFRMKDAPVSVTNPAYTFKARIVSGRYDTFHGAILRHCITWQSVGATTRATR